MSNKQDGGGFTRPPRPTSAEEFIAGATRPQIAEPAQKAKAPKTQKGEFEPLDFEDSPRIGKLVLRTSPRENAVLEWVYENKPGVRSKHDYILKAVQRQLEEDLASLTGKDFTFNPDDA